MAKKTIAENISAFENERAAKAARMTAIMEEAGEEGVTLTPELEEEYDGLETEVKKIDDHLVRLHRLEETTKAAAVAVKGNGHSEGADSRGGVDIRPGAVISVRRNLPPGIPFARFAMAVARSRGNLMQAVEIAKNNERWHDTPEVVEVLRSAVAAGTTTDAAWALPLVPYTQMAGEFIEWLRPLTIVGRIPGLRRVPFNISLPRQTAGGTVNWVGQTAPKPLTSYAFETVTLRFTKMAGITVLSDELVRFSNPAAEALVRDQLGQDIVQFMDEQFIDPSVTVSANVSPASITNGAPTSAASGTTADALRTDLKTALASFAGANIPASGLVWVLRSNQAASLAMLTNTLGQPEFPSITTDGGRLFGFEVVVSDSVPINDVVLLKPSEILLADDGQVTIDISREASLQMDNAPDNPPTASTNMVSMFQTNSVAIRAERYVNWLRRRTEAVYVITGADYGTVSST